MSSSNWMLLYLYFKLNKLYNNILYMYSNKIMVEGGLTDWKSCENLIACLNQEGNTKEADILS